ncbi:uncharacterized mitochondrial protein AtMg00810-like [Juglans microcarpa x Juglans regia]|uniref:uncharacterized mitochondrial protein AtMg00810-like n=1 Tax=Juglans microcarpa x Juglans regia TaxID=2249226 RepID=UPI001B7DE5BE|nr:uncharacterized mitochondrial protein AtMg00810-like [Juglans microcarpa x Juglans regia]
MPRDKNFARVRIKAFVTFVEITDANEDAFFGPKIKLVFVKGSEIRITSTTESLNDSEIECFVKEFFKRENAEMSSWKPVNEIGVEVISISGGLLLSQRQYILNLLNIIEAKPVSFFLSSSQQLPFFYVNPCLDENLFHIMVGALQYLSLTRPDISFAVNKVCQFMHKPTDIHWTVVKRILRYLKFSIDFSLLIKPSPSTQLSVYSNADWAGSPNDRKSTFGYYIYYGHNLISWSSKKQLTVARSSTEAEYRVVAHATAEALWLLSLLRKL